MYLVTPRSILFAIISGLVMIAGSLVLASRPADPPAVIHQTWKEPFPGFLDAAALPAAATQLRSRRLDAPDELKNQGVKNVELFIAAPNQIALSLFGDAGEQLGTAEIVEHTYAANITYGIRMADGRAFSINVQQQAVEPMLNIVARGSNGRTLTMEVERDQAKSSDVVRDKVAIKAIRIHDGNRWTPAMPLKSIGRGPKTTSRLEEVEDRVLYTNQEAKILKAVMRTMSDIQKTAFQPASYSVPDKPGRIVLAKVGATRASCRAFCYRVTSMSPIFACDDGTWEAYFGGECSGRCENSEGYWYLWDQCNGAYFSCLKGCGTFDNGSGRWVSMPGGQEVLACS